MQTKLIAIKTYISTGEAYIAKAKLDSYEITSFLFDEGIVGVHPFYANTVGGIRLMVPESEAEKAIEILGVTERTTKEEEYPHCPNCGASDTQYSVLSWIFPFLYFALFITIFPFIKKKWKCNICGYKWKSRDLSSIDSDK